MMRRHRRQRIRVNTFVNSDQQSPNIAMDGSGNFVIAWSGAGRKSGGVFAQRYDAAGVPLGSEFRVNTFTNSDQRSGHRHGRQR